MKKIYVKWIDSCSITGGGWHHSDEIDQLEPMVIETVGYLYKETKQAVTIVSSVAEHDAYCGDICIPKFAIKKRRCIK